MLLARASSSPITAHAQTSRSGPPGSDIQAKTLSAAAYHRTTPLGLARTNQYMTQATAPLRTKAAHTGAAA